MTNVDPQAILGPKASLTKLAWVNLPKNGDGAFSAFMAEVLPVMVAESGDTTVLADSDLAPLRDDPVEPDGPIAAAPVVSKGGDGETDHPANEVLTSFPEATPIKAEKPIISPDLQQMLAEEKVEPKTKTVTVAPVAADTAGDVDVDVDVVQAPPTTDRQAPMVPAGAEQVRADQQASTENTHEASEPVKKTETTEALPQSDQPAKVPVTTAGLPEKARAAEQVPVFPIGQPQLAPTSYATTVPQPAESAVPLGAGMEKAEKPTTGLITAQPKKAQGQEPAYQRSKIAAVQYVTGYEMPAPADNEGAPRLPTVPVALTTDADPAPFETSEQKPVPVPAKPTEGVAPTVTPEPVHRTVQSDQMPLTPPKTTRPPLPPAPSFDSGVTPAPAPLGNVSYSFSETRFDNGDKTTAEAVPQPKGPAIIEAFTPIPQTYAKPDLAPRPMHSETPHPEGTPQKPAPQGGESPVAMPAFPNVAKIEEPIKVRLMEVAKPLSPMPEKTPERRQIAPPQHLATPQIPVIAPPRKQIAEGKEAEDSTVFVRPSAPTQMAQTLYADRANVAPQPAPVLPGFSAKPQQNTLTEAPELPTNSRQWGEALGSLPASTVLPATPLPGPTAVVVHQPISVSAVATMIKDHAAPGKAKTIELTLAPEELGQVRLLLQPDGDKMRIVVQAERPETLEMLRRNTEAFSSELRQSGFANTSFTFGGWGEQPGKSAMPQKNSEGVQTIAGPAAEIPFPTPAPRISTGLDLRV
ncbi:flagellar hook-length control protein FliK [Pseudorhodobacter sp. E13]|nr:flagellar hook-length control protein FliK [Pseudorhodobacter sp. E13]